MKNKAVKAGIGYTLGNYLLKGIAFISVPIFARIMSVKDYGIYNTLISYESIIAILIGCAIHSSYKNARYKFKYLSEGAENNKDFNTYISTTILYIWINTALWLVSLNVLLLEFPNLFSFDILDLNLLIIYSSSSAIIMCFNSDASLNYKYKSFLKISLINSICNISFSLILIQFVFHTEKYIGRMIGTALPIFLLSIVITIYYFKKSKPKNILYFLRWGLNYSLPIIPHGISQVILSQFDRIMINGLIGAIAAGIYSFAYNIYLIVSITVQSLDNVWNTWFYEQMTKKNMKSIKNVSNFYIFFILLFCLAILLISPELIKLLGSNKYQDSIYCVIPIVASGFFSFLYNLPASVEYYFGKTKYIAVGTMLAAIVNIVLNYLFIGKFGYVAAAYTTLITYILYFLFHYFLAKKITGKFIYSNKIIFISSMIMILGTIIAQILIERILLRFTLLIFVIGVAFIIEEMNFSLIKKVLRR